MSSGTPVYSNAPTATSAPPQEVPNRPRAVARQHQTGASATPRKTGADIIRQLAENKAQREAQVRAVAKTKVTTAEHDARVEDVYARLDANAVLTAKINTLNKQKGRHPKGSVAEQNRENEIDETTEGLRVIQDELEDFKTNHSLAYEEGGQRYNRRFEANEMADTNRRATATVTDIRGRIDLAVQANFVVSATEDDFAFIVKEAKKAEVPSPTFSFDRKYFTAVKPWDSEAIVAVSISEMINDLQSFHDAEDEKIMTEVKRGEYFVSIKREPTGKGDTLPSGLDLMKRDGGFVRRPSPFLFAGKGQFYAVRVGHEFVVLENREGTLLAVKVTGPKVGRVLCTVPDRNSPRESGIRVVRPTPVSIVSDGHTISPDNLSGIWWDKLRQALEQDLQRERDSLTSGGLRDNEKGVCTVSVNWKTGDVKDPKSPEVYLRGKLVGTGNGTFQAKDFNSEVVAKVDPKGTWLAKAIQAPQPLETLDSGKWPALLGLNKTHERDWQLDNMAEDHEAVRVSTENVDDLTSLENGKDDFYRVQAMIRKPMGLVDGKPKFRKNAVGYIVQRSGSTIEIVDAVSGTSAAYANKVRGKYEMTNLPWEMKVILGSQYYGVRRQAVPEHLRLDKKQQETESNQTAE